LGDDESKMNDRDHQLFFNSKYGHWCSLMEKGPYVLAGEAFLSRLANRDQQSGTKGLTLLSRASYNPRPKGVHVGAAQRARDTPFRPGPYYGPRQMSFCRGRNLGHFCAAAENSFSEKNIQFLYFFSNFSFLIYFF